MIVFHSNFSQKINPYIGSGLDVEVSGRINIGSLATSIFIVIITTLILSTSLSNFIIRPLTFDGTLSKSGRYGFVFPAWDTISEDDAYSVIGIGSSLTQYGINGSCMTFDQKNEDAVAYNLGVPGSAPYLDMIQTERAINSNPGMIILEVNPISLTPVSSLSEENIHVRLTISSLFLRYDDYGGWESILEESDLELVDGVFFDRYNSESRYFASALEEMINRYQENGDQDEWWTTHGHWYSSTPYPDSERWNDYLIEPTWLKSYLSKLNPEELMEYENKTIPNMMKRERYNPGLDSNLNHEALEYMVSSFSSNGIPVLLVSYPIHPIAVENLSPNQLDNHNSTIEKLLEYGGVDALNLIWGDQWGYEDFYDYEHLNHTGRLKMCSIISNKVNNLH